MNTDNRDAASPETVPRRDRGPSQGRPRDDRRIRIRVAAAVVLHAYAVLIGRLVMFGIAPVS
ncbi:MAG: hypothetical protein NUV72_02095, partial [Bauldia sp.]|nr:hypothetical protein [Bauldia sp.]